MITEASDSFHDVSLLAVGLRSRCPIFAEITIHYAKVPLHMHIQHAHTSHCLYILTLIYCAETVNECVSIPGYREYRCIWIEGSRLDPANGAAVGMR